MHSFWVIKEVEFIWSVKFFLQQVFVKKVSQKNLMRNLVVRGWGGEGGSTAEKSVLGNLYNLFFWFRTNNNHCTGATGQLECWNVVQDKLHSQLRSPELMENQRGDFSLQVYYSEQDIVVCDAFVKALIPAADWTHLKPCKKENKIKVAISWPSWGVSHIRF